MSNGIFIFGLGNPGREYRLTRHNFGFMALDAFSRANNFPDFTDKKDYSVSTGTIAGKEVFLIKPLTFMNLSGKAVKESLNKFGRFDKDSAAEDSNIVVIHDDLDIGFGNVKVKAGGSGGSHNGVNSVINTLQSKNFIRVKLGIDSSGRREAQSGADFVLSNFSKEEAAMLPDILEAANGILSVFISEGLVPAMNKFNNSNNRGNRQT